MRCQLRRLTQAHAMQALRGKFRGRFDQISGSVTVSGAASLLWQHTQSSTTSSATVATRASCSAMQPAALGFPSGRVQYHQRARQQACLAQSDLEGWRPRKRHPPVAIHAAEKLQRQQVRQEKAVHLKRRWAAGILPFLYSIMNHPPCMYVVWNA